MKFNHPTADLLHELATDTVNPALAQSALEVAIERVYELKREVAQATRWATRANRLAELHAVEGCMNAIFERMNRDYPHWLQCPVNQGELVWLED